MEIKDKRNIGLIIGNYYRPSGSDKRQLGMFMQIKMPKETSMVWVGYASIVLQQRDVPVTFLEKTVGSIRV